MPASAETTATLRGLSPVADKPIIAAFDAEGFSASGGLLTLREIERRLGLAPRLAAHIADPREPTQVVHPTEEIIRFRMLMIAAGYEDGNDADVLRHDPMFKLAMGRLPAGLPLCSQSTISRLENRPDKRTLLRMGYGLIDLYCDSVRQVPRRIVLDIDDHFDAAHGAQERRVFNAHYDEHGFSPLVVFDGEGRLVAAVLRPAQRPSGREIVMLLRRLIGRLRATWPRVEILLRGDSHYCAPEVLRFCRANRVDFVLGVATTSTLRRHVLGLEQSTAKRFAAAGGRDKVRRFKDFYDGAGSWDRVERIIARVEAGPEGVDTRFITTSLAGGSPRVVYEKTYCQRGQMENHIKAFKRHLAADRTSCHTASANQMRLFLHAGAYWILWTLRAAMPRRSSWRRLQFDTLRLLAVSLIVRVVELKQQVRLHLPACTPDQALFAQVLGRLPRLIC
ncbi:MAG: IS1380 family transposase [Rhodopila sp.]